MRGRRHDFFLGLVYIIIHEMLMSYIVSPDYRKGLDCFVMLIGVVFLLIAMR